MTVGALTEKRPLESSNCPWITYCADYLQTCEGVCRISKLASGVLVGSSLIQRDSAVNKNLKEVIGFLSIPECVKNICLLTNNLWGKKFSQSALCGFEVIASICESILFLHSKKTLSLNGRFFFIRGVSWSCFLLLDVAGFRDAMRSWKSQQTAIAKESTKECIEHFTRMKNIHFLEILTSITAIALSVFESAVLFFGCILPFSSLLLTISTGYHVLCISGYFANRFVEDMTPHSCK